MSECVWLLRHGETEWTERSLHTGLRDVPLSEAGRDRARHAGRLLEGLRLHHVLVSPQTRAQETCRLAGLTPTAPPLDDLVEWDYGDYEGLTDEQTQERQPGWNLFRDGAPGGESPAQVTARVDRVIALVAELQGTVMLVGHGKLLRALAGRWVEHGVALGSVLPMDPAAIGTLERDAAGPLLRLWNVTGGTLPAA